MTGLGEAWDGVLAKAAALAFGQSEDQARDQMAAAGVPPGEINRMALYRTFPGDRHSTKILFRWLDPAALGRLIALFEHNVFVQGANWNLDPFDQWG